MSQAENGAAKGIVLIVEDEDVLRMTFEEFLTEDGYQVYPTSSYAEAHAVLSTHAVDVVVSDIILGERTGMDLLQDIHERDLRCKVVMITGDPSLETASQAVRLNAYDYLAKPVNSAALLRVVRLAMESKRVEDERDRYRSELDAIFNSIGSGILTVDTELRIQQANTAAREMLGLRGGVAGERLADLRPDAVGALADAMKRSAIGGETVSDIQFELAGANGAKRVVVMNVVPLRIGRQRWTGAVAVLRDITRLVFLEGQVKESASFYGIVGGGREMKAVYQLIQDLSETDATVLILGESGTGKELAAEAIHRSSRRAAKPLIKVSCAALADDVLESELFGHVRGAFTGAIKDRVGRFELANGGTIFLDEIGDISPRLQMRLLRVLQEGQFERVGESKSIGVDVRLIAATNCDLPAKIRAGEFRQDLYYRLNVVRVELPPLRDRPGDLIGLVEHFIRMFNRKMNKSIAGITPESLETLLAHSWPGNVRELENCIERAFVVCRDTAIRPEHLPREVLTTDVQAAAGRILVADGPASEPAALLRALQETGWNIAKTARKLGISRNTVYQRIQDYNIARPEGV